MIPDPIFQLAFIFSILHSTPKALYLLPPATVVAGRQCFHKCVSRILSTGEGCVSQHFPGQTPPGQTPLSRADTPYPKHYGIRSTSGRYASYWNAFLWYLKRLSFFQQIRHHTTNTFYFSLSIVPEPTFSFITSLCHVFIHFVHLSFQT